MYIEVPENARYVLLRGKYEITMAIENMCFMLSQHINDTDISYLNSDQFNNMQDKITEKYIQDWSYQVGIACQLTGNNEPKNIRVSRDLWEMEVSCNV